MGKERLIKVAVSFLVVLYFMAVNPSLVRSEELETYKSESYNFTVAYPAGWKLEVEDGTTYFTSPPEHENDYFLENVNIIISEIDYSPSISDLEQMQDGGIQGIEKEVSGFTLLEKSRCQINEMDAVYAVYEALPQDKWFKVKQYAISDENKVYILTYTALKEAFDDNLSKAETIIKSFQTTKE